MWMLAELSIKLLGIWIEVITSFTRLPHFFGLAQVNYNCDLICGLVRRYECNIGCHYNLWRLIIYVCLI